MTSAGTFTIFQLRFTVKKVQRLLRLHLFLKSVFTGSGIFFVLFCRFTPVDSLQLLWLRPQSEGEADSSDPSNSGATVRSEESRIFSLLPTDFMSLEPTSNSQLNRLSLDGSCLFCLCSVWANDKLPGVLSPAPLHPNLVTCLRAI